MRSFGPYTNLVEIGRGGMATVYRATAPEGHLVALKLLPLHLAADRTARTRFEQESNLGLSHPNIVRATKYGVEGDIPYIEMDYVAGESLDRLIGRAGSLSPRDLAPILIDAGRALDYAHERGVVHRDVKPSNIIVRPDGHALLADFGVAKAMGVTAYTATTARVGSVYFMSPEQASGAFEVTRASDIYSLGVTAYYALTGRVPFEAGTDIAVARQHVEQQPRHVSDVSPSIPRAVGDVVMWAMEKSPSRRPASAGAFARGFVTALTTPSAPSPIPPRSVARAQPSPPPPQPSAQPPQHPAIAPAQAAAPSPPPSRLSPTLDEELERRGQVPRWVWVGGASLLALAIAAMLAVVLLSVPGVQGTGRATPMRNTPTTAPPQPGLVVFTVQPTAQPAPTATPPGPVLAPLVVSPQATPVMPVLPVMIVPTPAPLIAPSPTRFAPQPPTRGPISPLTPIAPRVTPLPPQPPTDTPAPPAPPTDTPAPPATLPAPPSAEPTSPIIAVTQPP